MDKQVTSTPPIPGNGGFWLPVFTLLTTCRLGTSNKCRYGEFIINVNISNKFNFGLFMES